MVRGRKICSASAYRVFHQQLGSAHTLSKVKEVGWEEEEAQRRQGAGKAMQTRASSSSSQWDGLMESCSD